MLEGLLGSVASGIFGRSSARKQQRFQERMASTQHQRQIADLKAAGLNPILSAGGSGSAAPGGASPQTPDFASSAIQNRRLNQELKNLKADENLKHQLREKEREQTGVFRLNKRLLETQIPEAMLDEEFWKKIGKDTDLKNLQKWRTLILGGSSALKAR